MTAKTSYRARKNMGSCPYCQRMMLRGQTLMMDYDLRQSCHAGCLIPIIQQRAIARERDTSPEP